MLSEPTPRKHLHLQFEKSFPFANINYSAAGQKPAARSGASLNTLLYALSLSERGRRYVEGVMPLCGPPLRPELRLSRIWLEGPSTRRYLPAGAADLRSWDQLPRYINDRSDSEINLWLAAVLSSSRHEPELRVLGHRLNEVSTGSEVSLLSLNVWGLPELLGDRRREERREARLCRELRALGADIVCLQEAWGDTRRRVLEQGGYRYQASPENGHGVINSSGLLTLSNYPIEASHFAPFTCRPGFERLARKGVLFTKVRLPCGRRLEVFNVHLCSEPERLQRLLVSRAQAIQVRDSQLDEVAALIPKLSTHSGIRVVLGDFNIAESQPQYLKLQRLFGTDIYRRRMGESPLHDLCDARAEEERTGYTFDPLRNVFAARHHHARERLDYAWIETKAPAGFGFRADRLWVDDPISDHFGVLFSINILAAGTHYE